MIAYSQAYGAAEIVGKINQFMSQQEAIVIDLTKKLNETNREY